MPITPSQPQNQPQPAVSAPSLPQLYLTAKACLGHSLVPYGYDPEYGCAISVNMIHQKAFGHEIGGGASTFQLLMALERDPSFQEVYTAQAGDILISATGTSTIPHTPIANGHTGIVALHGICSNNSFTGLWSENYTLETWRKRYVVEGGYKMRLFRKII